VIVPVFPAPTTVKVTAADAGVVAVGESEIVIVAVPESTAPRLQTNFARAAL